MSISMSTINTWPDHIKDQIRAKLAPKVTANGITKVTVMVEPMGKPRMTRRDKWDKRECVVRYRTYSDRIKEFVRDVSCTGVLSWTAYISMPDSWSKKKKEQMKGKPHQVKPDKDNIEKGILDSLFTNDSFIYSGSSLKLWDDGKGARLEIIIS